MKKIKNKKKIEEHTPFFETITTNYKHHFLQQLLCAAYTHTHK